MEDRHDPVPGRRQPMYMLVLALLAGALLTAALVTGGGAADDSAEAADAEDAARSADAEDAAEDGAAPDADTVDSIEEARTVLRSLERRVDGDPLALGSLDAPAVLILWSDFQCAFCAEFSRETMPVLVDSFVDQGVLRIEWRDLPLLGPTSLSAAMAGRAAAEQGAFWELHDAIFAEEPGSLDEDDLAALADEVGLDPDQYLEDLVDDGLLAAVAADRAVALELGLSGTPGFLVNGYPVMGSQPVAYFVELIEHVLDEG